MKALARFSDDNISGQDLEQIIELLEALRAMPSVATEDDPNGAIGEGKALAKKSGEDEEEMQGGNKAPQLLQLYR